MRLLIRLITPEDLKIWGGPAECLWGQNDCWAEASHLVEGTPYCLEHTNRLKEPGIFSLE